jgi:LemA protein
MKALIGCGAVIAVMLLGSVMVGGCVYGKVVTLRNANTQCDTTFAQVDNMLERKCKLVPNLVSTVKGIAKHEQGVVDSVTKARAALLSATGPEAKSAANEGLTSALGRLMVVVENYPNIKADTHFTQLMDELAGSENRIAVARMDYNKDVSAFNKQLNDPINGFVAGFVSLKAREFFRASDDAKANNIQVQF